VFLYNKYKVRKVIDRRQYGCISRQLLADTRLLMHGVIGKGRQNLLKIPIRQWAGHLPCKITRVVLNEVETSE
jgi:hypothetical protein